MVIKVDVSIWAWILNNYEIRSISFIFRERQICLGFTNQVQFRTGFLPYECTTKQTLSEDDDTCKRELTVSKSLGALFSTLSFFLTVWLKCPLWGKILIADMNIVCVTTDSQASLAQGNARRQIHMSLYVLNMLLPRLCYPSSWISFLNFIKWFQKKKQPFPNPNLLIFICQGSHLAYVQNAKSFLTRCCGAWEIRL